MVFFLHRDITSHLGHVGLGNRGQTLDIPLSKTVETVCRYMASINPSMNRGVNEIHRASEITFSANQQSS